jgi:hypothetical protein
MGRSSPPCTVFFVEKKKIVTGKRIFSLIMKLINFVFRCAGTAGIIPSMNCILKPWRKQQMLLVRGCEEEVETM